MSYAELVEKLRGLPQAKQAEVFDFVEFLASRFAEPDDAPRMDPRFAEFSLGQAMRGMEDDPVVYSHADIRDAWR